MSTIPSPEATAAVDAAIASRRAVRAFLPIPVARETVEAILRVASRAPSGSNIQPWQVHVLTGAAREAMTREILAAYDDPAQLAQHAEEYDYYPKAWFSPYVERRRKLGWDLYALAGIAKGDKARMHAQLGRNFRFFDAPVGLVFTMDRALGAEHLLSCGRFLQNVMLHARLQGLHTCPQAAWNQFAGIILPHVGATADEVLVCAMALGHADPDAIVNRFHTPRLPVQDFCRTMT